MLTATSEVRTAAHFRSAGYLTTPVKARHTPVTITREATAKMILAFSVLILSTKRVMKKKSWKRVKLRKLTFHATTPFLKFRSKKKVELAQTN